MSQRNGISIEVDDNGKFTITGQINENPPLSASEKNFTLASTLGNFGTGYEFNGEEIFIGLNMYAKVSELPKQQKKATPKPAETAKVSTPTTPVQAATAKKK